MFVYKGASQAQLHKAKGKVTFGKEEGLIAISGTMASWKAFQANLLIYIHVKPLQPILHTNHPPLTVMALSQGFYGFSPVEKYIY